MRDRERTGQERDSRRGAESASRCTAGLLICRVTLNKSLLGTQTFPLQLGRVELHLRVSILLFHCSQVPDTLRGLRGLSVSVE